MKTCPICGNALPEEASFCPHCASSLIKKEKAETLKVFSRKWIPVIVSLLVLLGVTVGLQLKHRPRTYTDDNTAKVLYKAGETSYVLVLRNAVDDSVHWRDPQQEYSRRLKAGVDGAVPLQPYVYEESTGENAAQAFEALLDRTEVTVEARSRSQAPELGTPAPNQAFE